MKIFVNCIMTTAFLISTISSPVFASEASLSWNANSEEDLSGYRVHYGTSSGTYTGSVDVGNQTTFTVTGLSPGTYYFSVTAYDISGNGSGFSNEVVKTLDAPVDTSPPVISNISTSNITSSGVSINWTTDEPASNQVEYGTDANYGTTTIYNSTFSANHSVVLNNLSPSTTYHFRLINSDESGNMAVSPDQTFTTSQGSDTTPPDDIQNFLLTADNRSILLSWTNPPDSDYKGVRIRFKTDGFPESLNDGILLGDFLGVPGGEGFTIHSNLDSAKTYYYSASAFDFSGNFQSTVYASVSPLDLEIPGGGTATDNSGTVSASGGCGMINPNNLGNPPGPGQAADMVGLLALLVIGLMRKTLKKLLVPAWTPTLPSRPAIIRTMEVFSARTRFSPGGSDEKWVKTTTPVWETLSWRVSFKSLGLAITKAFELLKHRTSPGNQVQASAWPVPV